MKIILASKSPRRSQLLQWAEIPFEIISFETNEDYLSGLSPEEVAMHIASNKALAVQSNLKRTDTNKSGYPILAADTIVVCDNKIIGKPADRTQALETLAKLSGKKHLVITGVCICCKSYKNIFAETTEVEFNVLSGSQIEYYVDNYKPYDKAGAYAIQEWLGVVGIKSIKGDFYNVMGLPVNRVYKELIELSKDLFK